MFDSADITYSEWAEIESQLLEQSRIVLSEQIDSPIPIGGGVRAPNSEPEFLAIAHPDPFG
ncbi:hypothetical protein GWO43_20500 [candidate division KSB1 bacterium]|nr:hypothetical protein [candidate division KSB1 bacterium]NIR71878.1 hypothetical protein [candidate division KSB1 bacterium]NIS26445.1 hypothetical protein [candidate division KSB1 bacterium]NIT73215.1 hypothetical protein [candidate division KSB1 bacterium]NIU27129.1 hypothetical protein [candidate division KSB1 bacterium]